MAKTIRNDICVGEELKISVDIAIERFRQDNEQQECEFPSSLTSTERAYIHRLCQIMGLKSKSKGKGTNRFITISKKVAGGASNTVSSFNLVRNSRHQIASMLQRFPLNNREYQDLLPRGERMNIHDNGNRELNKTTTGKLNNGVPQVPPLGKAPEFIEFRKELPVSKMRDSIVSTIFGNKIVIISGETGSGKTTQVPQMILDECVQRNEKCRIFCTQPRRLAALSVAERVASERGEKIGQTIGYQIRLESKVSPKTLLTFCTNGVLLRTLMGGDQAMANVTHVLIDEVHERDRFSDFLLIALRQNLNRFPRMRLVLMSARVNTDLFSSYFNGCPIIEVPGRLFDVRPYFLADVLKVTGYDQSLVAKQGRREKKDVRKSGTAASMKAVAKITATEQDDAEPTPAVVGEVDALLAEAWCSGKEDALHQLIHLCTSENISVDQRHSQTSLTALMIAAGRGFYSVCEQLISLGAGIDTQAANGWTSLDWAARFQHTDIQDLLEANRCAGGSAEQEWPDEVEESEEDRKLLEAYHNSFDDEKIDEELVVSLLSYIHSGVQDGAILVFLPGYDDIVAIRDRLLEDDRFNDSNSYIVYTLHSQMQSPDQKRVFKATPRGVRKIILSTNIAESSITINDVVFVVDCGKVKVKSFDAFTSVTMLKPQWISQSSAIQRRGRAGRVREGFCYHLFSRTRYTHMPKFDVAEILRYPLQELCIQTKLLAPSHVPIADFLSQAPEPPPDAVTRRAVHLLKQMSALDEYEDLTELGHHLADLPIEPRYGKMILNSVVLKCLDPVLTIACALAYKDPFMLPSQPQRKRMAAQAKRRLSAFTFSDHMALLRAFQMWQKARAEGWERSFCDKHYISAATMEMIVGMRTQLLGQLRASGFVRARGGGDIRDLNTNSENWAVVKAALCAGLYPRVLRVDRAKLSLTASKESRVRCHVASVLSPDPSGKETTHAQSIAALPSDWLVYEEMTRPHRLASVRCCTLVSAITVVIFAGPDKLPAEIVREAEMKSQHVGQGDGLPTPRYGSEEHSDSDEAEDEQTDAGGRATFRTDEWISFRVDAQASHLTLNLRRKWHALFIRRMRAPSKPWSQVDECVIRTLVQVLTNEELALGLQQPSGIGQRPRPMSTECGTLSVGGARRMFVEDVTADRMGTAATATPPRHAPGSLSRFHSASDFSPAVSAADPQLPARSPPELLWPRVSEGLPRHRHWDRQTLPSARYLAEQRHFEQRRILEQRHFMEQHRRDSEMAATFPSWLERDRLVLAQSAVHPHHCRYYVMKCGNADVLRASQELGVWATQQHNQRKISAQLKEGRQVYLIFSIQGSGHFQGVAVITADVSMTSQQPRPREFSSSGLGGLFTVEWLKTANLRFRETHHLINPWNDNQRVQISRDGQELEPNVGEILVRLWDDLELTANCLHSTFDFPLPREGTGVVKSKSMTNFRTRGAGRGGVSGLRAARAGVISNAYLYPGPSARHRDDSLTCGHSELLHESWSGASGVGDDSASDVGMDALDSISDTWGKDIAFQQIPYPSHHVPKSRSSYDPAEHHVHRDSLSGLEEEDLWVGEQWGRGSARQQRPPQPQWSTGDDSPAVTSQHARGHWSPVGGLVGASWSAGDVTAAQCRVPSAGPTSPRAAEEVPFHRTPGSRARPLKAIVKTHDQRYNHEDLDIDQALASLAIRETTAKCPF